jgi:type 1 glutamine amidotransferase
MTRRNLMLTLASAPAFAKPAPPPRVMLVTGGHDHPASFYAIFDTPELQVTVEPHPRAFAYDMRKRFDAIVLYDMIKTGLEENKRANLRAFAEAGKGVVIVHHALCSHGDWPWWCEEFAGARWVETAEPGLPASTYKEGLELEMRPVAPGHPVVEGIRPFRLIDETYGKLWFAKGARVLMKTTDPSSDGPVVWVGPWKKSRVITVQPGHGEEAHRDGNYRRLLRNAILWASGVTPVAATAGRG